MHTIKKETRYDRLLFVLLVCLEMIFYFLNDNKYFQLSGFYVPMLFSFLIGAYLFLKDYWRMQRPQVALFLCGITALLSFLLNIGNNERGYTFSYLFLIVFSFLITTLQLQDEEKDFLYLSYILMGTIISLIVIIFSHRYYQLEKDRITMQIGNNPAIDPNYLAFFLLAPVILAFQQCINQKKIWIKIIFFVSMALGIVAIFMTGSRGAFLALFLAAVFIVYRKYKTQIVRFFKRLTWKKGCIFAGVVIVTLLLVYLILPDFMKSRFFDLSTWLDESNERRLELWWNALVALQSAPLYGFGLSQTQNSFGVITGIYEPAHNTIFEIWGQLGILGLISVAYLFVHVFEEKNVTYAKAICIATIVASVFISTEATLAFWTNVSLALLLADKEKSNGEKKDAFFSECRYSCVQCQGISARMFKRYMQSNVS